MQLSGKMAKMVHSFAGDPTISDADISDALQELDEEFVWCAQTRAPVSLERYRLRKVLRAVARARHMGIA